MPQLTFRVGADTLAATTAMDRLTAKVQDMTVKIEGSGDKFTQLDRNAEQLARRLGVELTGSTNKQIEAFKSLHDYLVKVGAPTRDVEAALKGLQAAQERYAEKAGPSFWDQHKTSILAAGTAITGFGVMAIKAFEESQLAGAKLQAVLKATGQAAGVTAEAAQQLADELSKMTGIDDEAILGAETILLHFTKIGKEVFPRATEAVLDLSKSLGKDLPTAALMVGKALESPAEGFEALQKATGKFTEAEVQTIKTMVAQGKVADAQAEVLKKLEGQFGGTARIIGDTFTGAMDKGSVAAENFMETIGAQLVPILQDLMKTFPDLSTAVIGTWNAFGTLNISAGDLAITAAALGPKIGSVAAFLGKAGLVGAVAIASVALGQFIGTLDVGGKTIDQWVQKLFSMTLFHGKTTAALGDTEKAAKQLNILLATPVYRNAGEDVESWYKRVLEAVKAHKELVPQVAYANTAIEKATNINKYHRISVQEQIEALKKEAQQVIATNGSNEKYNEILSKIESLEKQSLATKDKVIQKQNQLAKIMRDDAAKAAKELLEVFSNLNDKVAEYGLTTQAVAERRELLDQFQVELPEALQNLPPYIQDVEASMERMGITSTAALDALAEQANADFEAIAADATKSAHDIELAMAAMMDANAAATAAHGTKVTGEWASAADRIQTKWGESTKAVGDIWSKQVSTIVTDFSKGIADIIFEGKSFGDTMINIFKELGKSMLRALVETLFTPLKGLLNQALEWIGGLFSGGSGGGATGGVGGTIGSTVGGLGGIGAAGGLGGLGGAVLGAGVGATVLGPMLGGGVGGSVAGATAGFLGAELIANIGASVAAGTGFGAGVTGFLGALGPVGGIIAGAVFGIGALIGLFTKRGKQKLHDTAIMEPFGKELWKARDAYHSAAALGDPDKEAQAREALLVSGISGWNEIVKAFELKSSADSQRKYIYDWIAAVNWDFLDKWKSYPGVKTPDTSYLPVQVMAEGGSGTVIKPTLFLAGERGAEDFAFSPQSKGGLGNFYQTVTIEKVETSDPEKFVDMLIGMAQTNRAGTKKRLKTVLA